MNNIRKVSLSVVSVVLIIMLFPISVLAEFYKYGYISEIRVSVIPPIVGNNADFNPVPNLSYAHYSLIDTYWVDETTGISYYSEFVYLEGHQYRMYTKVNPNAGYGLYNSYSGNRLAVNNKVASYNNGIVSCSFTPLRKIDTVHVKFRYPLDDALCNCYVDYDSESDDFGSFAIEQCRWEKYSTADGGFTAISPNDHFVPYARYRVVMKLRASDGYYFGEYGNAYANGEQAQWSYSYDENRLYLYYECVVKPAIRNVEVFLEEPILGDGFEQHIPTVNSDCNYHFAESYNVMGTPWSDLSGGIYHQTTVFTVGRTYLLQIPLYADDGYCFSSDVIFTINGREYPATLQNNNRTIKCDYQVEMADNIQSGSDTGNEGSEEDNISDDEYTEPAMYSTDETSESVDTLAPVTPSYPDSESTSVTGTATVSPSNATTTTTTTTTTTAPASTEPAETTQPVITTAPVAPSAPSAPSTSSDVSVSYSTHVQNIGWQDYVYDGAMAGTEGRSLRLEAMAINVDSDLDLGVRYKTHVQNVGWQDWSYNGEAAGTSGQSLRLEGMKIELTGSAAADYDIYYRVHVQNIGWMDWVENGEMAGTEGQSLRLEGMQIKIVRKGDAANFISYNTHVQNIGWQSYVTDGVMAGTTGRSLRLEGIHISVDGLSGVGVQYRTHIQNIGWEDDWTYDGGFSGTEGQSLRLEAIEIQLTGENADQYDIYYRTHVQNFGWTGWASNGTSCGSAGYAYRLEGIEIIIVPDGAPAPGSTSNAFYQA